MKSFGTTWLVAILSVAGLSGAQASSMLVTNPAGYTGPQLDLAAFANGDYNHTNGPVFLPNGITFTAAPGPGFGGTPNGNSGDGSIIGQGSYGLLDNGSFGGTATYIGVDSGTGFATLTFAEPVSSFGGFFNYASPIVGNTPTISAFDASGGLIASYDLAVLAPISTPGGFNEFAFRGIQDSSADIKSFQFGGSYLVLAGTADGAVSPVPLPASAPMFGAALLGLAGLGYAARRKKAAAAAA